MSKSNIHFIVQSLPANEEQFQEKLQTLSEKRGFHAPSAEDIPPALQELQQYVINQCVVAPKHIAFLLEDGRVCRVKYIAHDPQEEETEPTSTRDTPSVTKPPFLKLGERPAKVPRTGASPWIISGTDLSSGNASALRRWGTHIGVIRSIASSSGSNTSSTTSANSSSARNRSRNNGSDSVSTLASTASGIRLVRSSQLIGRGRSLLTGQRVIVPASLVPEELVNQVQGILQGKSRSIIIRELQRTNLDVNLAVNNLLSRDDEDNEDMDDNGGDYIPGEDLLSLLDSGNHPGEHGVFMDTDAILPEELLGYTLHRTSRTSSSQRSGASGGDSSSNVRDLLPMRDPIIRLRNRRFFEPVAPWDNYENESSSQAKSTTTLKKAKVTKELESVNIGEQLEWWMENDEYVKFVQIGSMYSELVGIDSVGVLRQWRWGRDNPYRHPTQPKIYHPRAQFLGLEDKKVVHLATCSVRASVMVESGGVATWIDKTVSRHASALEHPVMAPVSPILATLFGSEKQKSTRDKCLHVCSLYTSLFTPSGEIYWWGVLPFHLRKKVLEKAQAKLKKALTTIKSSRSSKEEVKAGSLVCLHSCPMFQAGAIAIYLRGGKPQIGCLQQSAWNLSDICTFKILKKRKFKKLKMKDKKQSEKKGDIKTDDDKKDDSAQPKPNESEVSKKETSVIQSNSERETVLKSTSSTPIVPTPTSEVQKSLKRKSSSKPVMDVSITKSKEEDAGDNDEDEEVEEQWNLQDVVFIEDVQTVPVGKVIKVDGDMVAVWFSKSGKFSAEKMEKESMLKNLRLLRKEDVHVLMSGSLPKVPECFLKTPRKINLDPGLKIHSICVNELGIQAIEGGSDGSPLTHLNINLLGKVTADCPFLSPSEMFFDSSGRDASAKELSATSEGVVCKLDRNFQDFPTIFRDRYSTLYPLLRNENSGFRDPHWLNLTPILTMGMGAYVPATNMITQTQKNEKSNTKMLMVTALVFKSFLMLPLIFRRDLKNLEQLLESLTPEQIQALCDEICDGQRNILHVAVSTVAPTSNRKQEEEEEEDQRKKEQKKNDAFFPSMTSATSAESRESSNTLQSTASTPTNTSTSRSSGGTHSMSDSERSNAVNAIANAISVVTRGERLGPASDTRPSRGSTSREPYSSSSDPFSMPVPPPSYVRSQLMRDFMQQFASSSPTVSSTVVSSSSPAAPASGGNIRHVRMPTIIRDGRRVEVVPSRRGAMDYGRLGESPPLRWSPPPVPTLSWPPEPVPYGMPPLPSGMLEEGLNLSVNEGEATVTPSGTRYVGKNGNMKAKRKRSITPPNTNTFKVTSKRGSVADGLEIIKSLCTSDKMQPILFKLLSQRDALGHTPFMSAIFHRAYPAALELFSRARIIARGILHQRQNGDLVEKITEDEIEYDCDNAEYEKIFMEMIYPNTTDRDANPLYMLCANDTCSFTWTGDNHINQDIFECWTCGLVGTLCCCSECARVCHNGHDCKLKKTNPTAYCDCWEKCACRSLVSGDANARKQLAKKLLEKTNLVNFSNSRGETLLQFLAQTVARQTVEQRQHRTRSAAASSRTSRTAKTTISGVEYDVPQHDLQPPQFCRDTYSMLLDDWKAVCATVMSNTPGHMDPLCASFLPDQSSSDSSILLPEEVLCMGSQTGTSRLDAFMLCLLVKCSTSYLDRLLHTFINRLQRIDDSADKDKDLEVVHRFVRSVVRVFVVLSVCSSSENQSGKQSNRIFTSTQPLKKAQRVFTALLPMAVEELCEMATALIDPVRMGVARPTSMFPVFPTGSDAVQGCETAFSRPPFPPRDKKKKKKSGGKGRTQRDSSASPRSFSIVETTTQRPIVRSNIARRGISRRRQNLGSSRTAGSGNGNAERDAVQRARDALHDALVDDLARNDALADDLVRITRREREQDDNSLLLDRAGFSVLPHEEDEEVDALVDDWLNQDEPNDNVDQEESTQEENQTQSTLQASESQEVTQPMQDDISVAQATSQEEDPVDSQDNIDQEDVAEDQHDTEPISDNQPELVSEGDLDLDDEDDDRAGQDDDDAAGDGHEDDESDMDLTLLGGSDADTDQDSNHSDEEERINQNGDEAARRDELNNMSRLLYSDEDDGLSGGDIGGDDDDDDDGDEDEDDRHTFTLKLSDDEAVTATDQDDDDGSSQEDEDIIDEDADDQDDEDAEEDEASQSELAELPLERAPTRLQRSRAAMTPHSMRWALGGSRPSNTAGTSSAGSRTPGSGTTGSGLIYIDSSSLRRGNPIGASAIPVGSGSGDSSKQGRQSPTHSAATTNAQLARAFGICVREMSSLLNIVWQGDHITNTTLSTFLELTFEDVKKMKNLAEATLSPTWKWLLTVIDSTEAQLRYGQVLGLAGSHDHIDHPLYKGSGKSPKKAGKGSSSDSYRQSGGSGRHTLPTFLRMAREANNDSNAARQDFLSYILSLMRAHSGEHADYLPVMDVSSLRHVAYVLDAMIFYLRETAGMFDEDAKSKRKKTSFANRLDLEHKYGPSLNLGYDNTDDEDEEEMNHHHHPVKESSSLTDDLYSSLLVGDIIANAQEEADPTIPYAQPQKTFFKRSESMTFLGCADPDPFTEPLVKALPLADKPHLLQTNARKEELFGRPRQQFHPADDASYFDPDLPGTGMGQLRHKITSNFEEKLERTKAELLGKKLSSQISIGTQTETEMAVASEVSQGASDSVIFPPIPSAEVVEKTSTGVEPMDTVTTGEMKPDDKQESSNMRDDLPDLFVLAKTVIVKTDTQNEDKEAKKEMKVIRRGQFSPPSVDSLLGRCRLTLELFTRVFLDDVGAEPKSILQELGGFEVRESKFRKEMEKLRNSQSVDLQLNVEREPHRLITQTFKQLNQHFRRRTGASSASLSTNSQPLAVQRVKVIFKDEPGEGSGVARSFYTALCEALLSSEKLPSLENILAPLGSSSHRSVAGIPHSLVSRLRKREQERERERDGAGRAGGRKSNLRSFFLTRTSQSSTATAPTTVTPSSSTSVSSSSPQISTLTPPFHGSSPRRDGGGSNWSRERRDIGDRLLRKVNAVNSAWGKKITGMLLGLPVSELLLLLSSESLLKNKIAEATHRLEQIQYTGEPSVFPDGHPDSSSENSGSERKPDKGTNGEKTTDKDKRTEEDSDHESDDEEVDVSTFPLFYQPGKRGFYSPAAGAQPKKSKDSVSKKSTPVGYEARLNAFRNVGRIIGLCLLQNELCPLPLNRHVLKTLLGRKINWHDFGFFDPVMYESMRFVLAESEKPDASEELLNALELSFVANPLPEEGGGEVELIPGGSSVSVTHFNLRDYVRRYTTYRMITCCHKYIERMREGLFDVLPRSALDGLTAEDLRLLANGCGRVNVRTLISYTSFNDESGKSAGSNTEKLTEFKRWFWTVVERMGHSARQELLYFWTGSPALPASEDGFQPMPTVTIRPPDDQHLPSANTCISRLYVPLYSTRTILKQKLMTAIKTKNFGFV